MESILPTTDYTEVEGRQYLNPQVALDEGNQFIDNLRSIQGQQNQEIMTDTQRLGTDIPSVQGGLLGPESYFISRYQTPQTNAVVANLRATAQAAALNDVLANEQAIWKEKYQQAYRNYQKRMRNKGYGGNGGGGGTTTTTAPAGGNEGDVTQNTSSKEIDSITTDPIARSIYLRKIEELREAGFSTKRAVDRVQKEMGLYGKSLNASEANIFSPENAPLLMYRIRKAAEKNK